AVRTHPGARVHTALSGMSAPSIVANTQSLHVLPAPLSFTAVTHSAAPVSRRPANGCRYSGKITHEVDRPARRSRANSPRHVAAVRLTIVLGLRPWRSPPPTTGRPKPSASGSTRRFSFQDR